MALIKKPRRLKSVTVNEVSIVDTPAVRQFLLFKRDASCEDLPSDKLVNPPALPADDDDDGTEAILVNYEFASMSEAKKQEILARIKKCLGILDSLEKSTIGESETAVLKDIWRLEAGMLILKGRSPGLYAEFCKADAESLKNDWVYTLDSQGIPLIQKRLQTDSVFETKSHRWDPDSNVWRPKQR